MRHPLSLLAASLSLGLTLGCSASETPGNSGGSGGQSGPGSGGAGGGGSGGAGPGAGTGGTTGSGGASGGASGTGGVSGSGGSGGTAPTDGGAGGSAADAGRDLVADRPADAVTSSDGAGAQFSFFVTSLEAMRMLSGSQNGFGGDLGGLTGADSICTRTAELGMPGAGQKTWRAFLSTTAGGAGGGPVHAIDRIGNGPWYDRNGRMFAPDKASLVGAPRPRGGDPRVAADMPNERGEAQKQFGDNHDTLTGSNRMGQVQSMNRGDTCNDWTSSVGATGRPNIGHSWPRNADSLTNGGQWIFDHTAPGCAAGVNLQNNGGGSGNCVGCGGGYGGLFCFAVNP